MSGEPTATPSGVQVELTSNDAYDMQYGGDFDTLVVTAEFQTNDRLRIKIAYDFFHAAQKKNLLSLLAFISRPKNVDRYEVPIEIGVEEDVEAVNALYDVKFLQEADGFALKVRKQNSIRVNGLQKSFQKICPCLNFKSIRVNTFGSSWKKKKVAFRSANILENTIPRGLRILT